MVESLIYDFYGKKEVYIVARCAHFFGAHVASIYCGVLWTSGFKTMLAQQQQ